MAKSKSKKKTTTPQVTIGASGIYIALLNQTETNNPTAIVQRNNIGEIVWEYGSLGHYTGTLTGAFPEGKTIVLPSNGEATAQVNAWRVTDDIIEVRINTQEDSRLTNASILILVYP